MRFQNETTFGEHTSVEILNEARKVFLALVFRYRFWINLLFFHEPSVEF